MGFFLGNLSLEDLEVGVATPCVDVDVLGSDEKNVFLPSPDSVEKVEHNHHRHRQHEEVQNHASHGSPDTDRACKGELVRAPAPHGKRFSEPHVAQTDRPPREDGRETGQSHQPGEDVGLLRRRSQETEQAKKERANDADERSSLSVDVAKDLWCKALLCKRGKRSTAGVDP
ncbi:hypothetical protein OGATHE_003044 [Ogataea polymorpha]|uniref:Uncharacterized protein n=1 Tax=Ogataea polymorpha TaxID=460523 RepID=A0A9P8T8W4_9ASCO|nr:hypothetical protein OGATHE_003044 [Ogataea polymorpha]